MKTAILVLGYKKIETFSKVIEALSKQTKQYDLYVKLDNCGDISYTNKLVDKVKEYFPNANISIRPKQFGLDLQVICSINEMFLLGYDRIFYTEDDVIYDSTALETLEKLMDYTDANIPNIGIVQSWNYNITDEKYLNEYKKLHAIENLWYNCTYANNEIGYTCQNFWGALISKKCWDKISPFILKHFSYIVNKQINYNYFIKYLANIAYTSYSNELIYRNLNRFCPIGWESILDISMMLNNYFKICLTNPRSKTIGIEGSTSTDDMFTKVGLDKIITIDDKKIPNEFILNTESKEKFVKNV